LPGFIAGRHFVEPDQRSVDGLPGFKPALKALGLDADMAKPCGNPVAQLQARLTNNDDG
jgi:hypothetical protein